MMFQEMIAEILERLLDFEANGRRRCSRMQVRCRPRTACRSSSPRATVREVNLMPRIEFEQSRCVGYAQC
jgi:hypothetical protein